jgi:hypothetical protein
VGVRLVENLLSDGTHSNTHPRVDYSALAPAPTPLHRRVYRAPTDVDRAAVLTRATTRLACSRGLVPRARARSYARISRATKREAKKSRRVCWFEQPKLTASDEVETSGQDAHLFENHDGQLPHHRAPRARPHARALTKPPDPDYSRSAMRR